MIRVEKLTPPNITAETILEKLVCIRPMREGKFNISCEHLGSKMIVNCYGHGGSGWTTLFGSVEAAIEIYEKTKIGKKVPIRVIGSGCMGLSMAIELGRRGYKVAGIITKSLFDLPSWRAAGYFAMVSLKTCAEEQANVTKIGMDTFRIYQEIHRGAHAYISQDVTRFMPVYCGPGTEAGIEDLVVRGVIPDAEQVTLDFEGGRVHRDYTKYMTYFVNTSQLMKQLGVEVGRLGIGIEVRKVRGFEELAEEVIFNCSGLGAKQLNSDPNMIPVIGHLVILDEKAGRGHMDYMIYSKVEQEGKEEYIYLFPKTLSVSDKNVHGIPCSGVLGGTFLPSVGKRSALEQKTLDDREFKRLLDRNCEFFYGRRYQGS